MSTEMNLRAHLSDNGVDEELRRVIAHLADSAKYISALVSESNREATSTTNLTGDSQLELDIQADKMIINRLAHETSFHVSQLASEEQDEIVNLNSGRGNYSVSVDPLDGSSLVDVNLAVGTIIGIHHGNLLDGRTGRDDLAAAMYIQYGPATTLVYTSGEGVFEFCLDSVGCWTQKSNDKLVMKRKGFIYGPGGLKKDWTTEHEKFIEELENEGYKLRYSGGLVPDFNQILIKHGGVFTYPKLVNKPEGKLRFLIELQPLAMIMEQAGGRATDGLANILDRVPLALDERSPIYIGSEYEVGKAREILSSG